MIATTQLGDKISISVSIQNQISNWWKNLGINVYCCFRDQIHKTTNVTSTQRRSGQCETHKTNEGRRILSTFAISTTYYVAFVTRPNFQVTSCLQSLNHPHQPPSASSFTNLHREVWHAPLATLGKKWPCTPLNDSLQIPHTTSSIHAWMG